MLASEPRSVTEVSPRSEPGDRGHLAQARRRPVPLRRERPQIRRCFSSISSRRRLQVAVREIQGRIDQGRATCVGGWAIAGGMEDSIEVIVQVQAIPRCGVHPTQGVLESTTPPPSDRD